MRRPAQVVLLSGDDARGGGASGAGPEGDTLYADLVCLRGSDGGWGVAASAENNYMLHDNVYFIYQN